MTNETVECPECFLDVPVQEEKGFKSIPPECPACGYGLVSGKPASKYPLDGL